MRRHLRFKRPQLAVCIGTLLVVAAVAAPAYAYRFSPWLYPPPVAPKRAVAIAFPAGSAFMCPNSSGLRPATSVDDAAVMAAAQSFNYAPTLERAKVYADRAGWPWVTAMFSDGGIALKGSFDAQTMRIVPALDEVTYSDPYREACGSKLLASSVVAIWCAPTNGHPLPVKTCLNEHPDLTAYDFFLNRRGHWLFWGFNGGA